MKGSFNFVKITISLAVVSLGLISFQQCSNIDLSRTQEVIELAVRSKNPLLIQYISPIIPTRRYVMIVDMSNSMISGPCYQNVEANLGFQKTEPFVAWDKNKELGDPLDHRGSGMDCVVDPTLSFSKSSISNINPNPLVGLNYKTPGGIDYEGHRLDVIENWVADARRELREDVKRKTEVLVYPITGGERQEYFLNGVRSLIGTNPRFLDLENPLLDDILSFLRDEQNKNILLVQDNEDFARGQKTTMGTSEMVKSLSVITELVKSDMAGLCDNGDIADADYQIAYLSDGIMTPKSEHFRNALDTFAICRGCAEDGTPGDGGGQNQCEPVCADLYLRMIEAWGEPSGNTEQLAELQIALVQTLPDYYGAGRLDFNLLQIKPTRLTELFSPQLSSFEYISRIAQNYERDLPIHPLNDSVSPIDFVSSAASIEGLEVRDIIMLNPTARYVENVGILPDSDSDGLTDKEEIEKGTDPTKKRTGGVCLDSMAVHPAYSQTCRLMAQSNACDPKLDTDGDGLNECEEKVMDSDPYDFDSDGDSIPDSYEWLYGYNINLSDTNLDANNDGYTNIYNFTRGLGPLADPKAIEADDMVHYGLNFEGKTEVENEEGRQISVDLYEMPIMHIPTAATRAADFSGDEVYYVKDKCDVDVSENYNLTNERQLIAGAEADLQNNILVLIRVARVGDDSRFEWRLKRLSLPNGAVVKDQIFDLSSAYYIRAVDFKR